MSASFKITTRLSSLSDEVARTIIRDDQYEESRSFTAADSPIETEVAAGEKWVAAPILGRRYATNTG
jgi:hypothetical protein